MSNRNESYLATSTTRLNVDFWNTVVRDISARISALEGLKPEIEALTDLARDLAVQRVNVALAEYVSMIEGVAEIGSIQTVLATGSASIGPGTKTIFVQLQDRDLIGNTGYVVVRPQNSADARMAGPITGYSSLTGQLQFEVVNAIGDGTENTWVVGYAKTVVAGPTGPAPEHEWIGTSLRFRNPDGSWGAGVDLEGEPGPTGGLDPGSLASEGEAQAGANNTKWMSPLRAAQAIAALGQNLSLASQGEAEAGSNNSKYMTPLRVAQAISALSPATPDATTSVKGKVELATDGEVQTGTDTARVVTPSGLTAKEATGAQYVGNTADRILTTDQVWVAAAIMGNTTQSALTSWDMSAWLNRDFTVTSNITIGNPSNVKVGQAGWFTCTASGGTRTIAKSSNIKAKGISWPVSLASGEKATFFYIAIASNIILITSVIKEPA